MEWWQVVLVLLLMSFVLFAIAAFVVWRRASAQTRRVAARAGLTRLEHRALEQRLKIMSTVPVEASS